MRIANLRLLNLNSLRGETFIDFQGEPLGGAGLFAITGQTGSGKSTLLDGITLALYGRAARYGDLSNPEDMLSRQAGECKAEVEFVVAQGRYRAVWHLRRARGKVDGKLQAAKRWVYGADGEVLAQSIREAEQLVEELIGLDYSRFLRSVLLAQGDFARFLKSKADERAALLESLTGTEIYSELSQFVHLEISRRSAEFTERERSLGGIVLLSDDARVELNSRLKNEKAALGLSRKELISISLQVGKALELRKALGQLAELKSRREMFEARIDGEKNGLESLKSHRSTIPFSDSLSQLDGLIKQTTAMKVALDAKRSEMVKSVAVFRETRVAFEWYAENALDSQRKGNQESIDERTLIAEKKGALETWFKENQTTQELEKHSSKLISEIVALGQLRKDLSDVEASRAELKESLEKRQLEEGESRQSVAALTNELKGWEEELGRAQKAKNELFRGDSEEQLRSVERASEDKHQGMLKLQELNVELGERRKLASAQGMQLKSLKTTLNESEQTLVKLRESLKVAKQDALLKRDHLRNASIVASLEEHRGVLVNGEPCPLCGALEHPLGETNDESVSLEVLQTEVESAHARVDQVEGELDDCSELVSGKRSELSEAEGAFRMANEELKKLEVDGSQLGERMGVGSFDKDSIREALKLVADSMSSERSRLKQALESQVVCAGLTDKAKATENALNQLKIGVVERGKALVELKDRISVRRTEGEEKRITMLKATETFEKRLKPFELNYSEPLDEEELVGQIDSRLKSWMLKRTEYDEAERKHLELNGRIDRKHLMLNEMRSRQTRVLSEVALDTSAVEPSVDGSTISKMNSDWSNVDQAEEELRRRARVCDEARSKVSHLEAELGRALGESDILQVALEVQVSQSETFDSLAEVRQARLELDVVQELEGLKLEIQKERAAINGLGESLESNIASLREDGVKEGPAAEALESEAVQLGESVEGNAIQVAEIENRLKRDKEERSQHEEASETLIGDRRKFEVWEKLHGLIGSHDGRKFRRYAQGISLDVLIHRANRHLQRLTERYRLRRPLGEELELEVEDLFQAGAMRPMASLSGGESFLASLALALGLADLAGRSVRIDSLFIDEGFGSLDSETLDIAISALETLRQQNKMVGVISHVELLKERIGTQIVVEKIGGGASACRIVG